MACIQLATSIIMMPSVSAYNRLTSLIKYFHLLLPVAFHCLMLNKNSLEADKKGAARNNWHDANLLTTTGSEIRLRPSINYPKHKAS